MHLEVTKLFPDDRLTWEPLFRAYMDFYGTSLDQAAYDRAWDAFRGDQTMHALGARIDNQLVAIVHFIEHASTTAADVCYLQDLSQPRKPEAEV